MGNGLELRDQPGVIQSWNVSPEWLQRTSGAFVPEEPVHRHGFRRLDAPHVQSRRSPDRGPGRCRRSSTMRSISSAWAAKASSSGCSASPPPPAWWSAKSENTKYDAWDITEGMDFEVFGRVLKVWRSEDF